MPKELDVGECPSVASHVWRWFQALDRERDITDLGPRPLTSEKLLAWCTLRRRSFTAFELEAITRLDSLLLSGSFEEEESDD
jgi:hypothetical protein